MAREGTVTAALIIIGNEILSGRTQDVNLAYIAQHLNDVGVKMSEVRVVPDIEDEIVDAVNTLRAKFDYVFTTGGIGPTHDDITSECVAKAFGQELISHPEALAILQEHYQRTGNELNDARLRMANTPAEAELIPNPISKAPGYRVENVFVMAGVPRIMQGMLEGIKPHLKGGVTTLSKAITSSVPEGVMAGGLGVLQDQHPEMDLGSYPFYKPNGVHGTTIIVRHTDSALVDQVAAAVADLMRSHGGEPEYRDTANE